jgi:ADP-heptose:LPS heptosyltransferase
MIELCEKINKPIILLGDKNDAKIGQEIEKYFLEKDVNTPHKTPKTIIFNACGKFNLNQSASLLQQAQTVFAHDTGLMHIAAALQKTIYSIWGNTTPSLGMYPYRTKFFILENNNIDCRPCSKIGFDKCPKGHFNCMNGISFEGI